MKLVEAGLCIYYQTKRTDTDASPRRINKIEYLVFYFQSDYRAKKDYKDNRDNLGDDDNIIHFWQKERASMTGKKTLDGRDCTIFCYRPSVKIKRWMEERDCQYLQQLLDRGELEQKEPGVWRLREIDHAKSENIAEIGDWWKMKLKLPNIKAIIEQLENLSDQQFEALLDVLNGVEDYPNDPYFPAELRVLIIDNFLSSAEDSLTCRC